MILNTNKHNKCLSLLPFHCGLQNLNSSLYATSRKCKFNRNQANLHFIYIIEKAPDDFQIDVNLQRSI